MAEQESAGTCGLCGESFSKSAMTGHLKTCLREARALRRAQDAGTELVEGARAGAGGSSSGEGKGKKKRKERAAGKSVHLLVEGRWAPEYWMHLEAPASAMLYEIDALLRHTWLECCGHLSAFRIGKDSYVEPAEASRSMGGRDMECELGEVLRPRMKFLHEYDFGTTTELTLRVVSMAEDAAGAQDVRMLARNDPPVIPCSSCGKPAKKVCTECLWDDKGWLCGGCVPKHECGEGMFLPVVNSPRVGQCGYAGPEEE